jgi:hypothetical protein
MQRDGTEHVDTQEERFEKLAARELEAWIPGYTQMTETEREAAVVAKEAEVDREIAKARRDRRIEINKAKRDQMIQKIRRSAWAAAGFPGLVPGGDYLDFLDDLESLSPHAELSSGKLGLWLVIKRTFARYNDGTGSQDAT